MSLERLRRHLLQAAPRPRQLPEAPPGGLRSVVEVFPGVLDPFPDRPPALDDLAAILARLAGPGPMVFWDVETCGLGDAHIFLIGLLRFDAASPSWRLELLLAEDPSQEPALLRAAAATLASARRWVTFNGRSFDLPRLRKRAFRHGVALPDCDGHIDLLLEVRRRWKAVLPDCRLGTVERELLGLKRGPGEVSGRKVPEHYQRFIDTGDRRWIEPVLAHNRQDVLALALLYSRLKAEGGEQEQKICLPALPAGSV